jgi:hypothetical protein
MYTNEYYKIHYGKYKKLCNFETIKKLEHMCEDVGENYKVYSVYELSCSMLASTLKFCKRINITKFKDSCAIIDSQKQNFINE